MKVVYPFEFDECLLDTSVLDQLGFGDYWGGSGDFGTRTLDFNLHPSCKFLGINLPACRVNVMDENEDVYCGMADKEFVPQRIVSEDFQTSLYFFHDLYEVIKKNESEAGIRAFDVFRSICFDKNFGRYIESWEKYKNSLK
jgi:hypothetical protein